MSKKPNYFKENAPKLEALCDELGLLAEFKSEDQWRIYGATHVIDIWPARMVYHRVKGEDVKAIEPYYRGLDWQFNKQQVKKLLETGKL